MGTRERAIKSVTYHVGWKEPLRLALCDPANAVTLAVNVQVSCEEHTSFSEPCGLTSLHTLIWKALFAFYLSPGTPYDWPGFSLL